MIYISHKMWAGITNIIKDFIIDPLITVLSTDYEVEGDSILEITTKTFIKNSTII